MDGMDGDSESWWRTSRGEKVARKGNATLRSCSAASRMEEEWRDRYLDGERTGA